MGTHLRVCCHDRSSVLLTAHDCSQCDGDGAIIMRAYDCICALKSAHEHSLVLMSVLSFMVLCSCVFMTAQGHSKVLMSTYKQT